ncbi:MAG: Asp-tRNA(Asn)/Glu-tRNA(Gln) amidotransferase subunit GatA [Pseudomonadota bacterium]
MQEPSIAGLAARLEARDLSATELCQHYLGRIEALNGSLNCVVTATPDQALAAAAASDQRRASGQTLSILDGIPILHKDLFCTRGVLTSCGSKMLANFVAPYDATVVSRLHAAGVVMLGKTNMDEFAMGSSNEHSHFGAVRNPWDLSRVAGGSSGGSAAAVAAGLAPIATGTDTGGSIRQPASFCGLTGLKPTYGRVSRYGMVAFASSLDQAGLFAPAAADLVNGLGVMSGMDPLDSTSADVAVEDYAAALGQSVRGLRVGLVREHFGSGLNNEVEARVRAVAQLLEQLGATILDVSLAESELTVPVYYVIALAEASANLSRFDGVRYGYRSKDPETLEDLYERSRSEGFGDEVKRRIMLGTYALSAGYYDAYYGKAQQLRRLMVEDFQRVFTEVDVILAPTAPEPAFELGALVDDPVKMYLSDVYTCPVNLAGLPAINIPAGLASGGLPIGVQFIGSHFSEAKLLGVADAIQRASDWHRARPECATGVAP